MSRLKLDNINLPKNLSIIHDNVFFGCESISSIIIPENVTSIGEFAFYDCDSLQTVELNKAMENYKDSVIVEEINVVEQNKALKKHSKAAIKQFDINLVPTVVFLNKDGAIIKKHRGLMKADEIIEVLNGIE